MNRKKKYEMIAEQEKIKYKKKWNITKMLFLIFPKNL